MPKRRQTCRVGRWRTGLGEIAQHDHAETVIRPINEGGEAVQPTGSISPTLALETLALALIEAEKPPAYSCMFLEPGTSEFLDACEGRHRHATAESAWWQGAGVAEAGAG